MESCCCPTREGSPNLHAGHGCVPDFFAHCHVRLFHAVEVVSPCRPRLLFQYLPYSQQEPLQMSQLDIAALIEAVCGAAGASGVWGVSAVGQCLLCVSRHQSLQCHRLLQFGTSASIAVVLLCGGGSM